MFTISGPHIDHGGYMSTNHVSPDLGFIFLVYCWIYVQFSWLGQLLHCHTTALVV